MGVFEFVIALILISGAAKIIERQRRSAPLPGEAIMVDPEEIYLREDDKLLKNIRSKIEAAEEGRTPELEPTFEESENK